MRLVGSLLDFALGQFVFACVRIRVWLEIARELMVHRLIAALLPGLQAELAHQLTFERAERARLERELWLLKRRVGTPANQTLCFCGRLQAVFYSFRYASPLKTMKSLIGLSGRTILRYRALLKRGLSFLVPKKSRKWKPPRRTPSHT